MQKRKKMFFENIGKNGWEKMILLHMILSFIFLFYQLVQMQLKKKMKKNFEMKMPVCRYLCSCS